MFKFKDKLPQALYLSHQFEKAEQAMAAANNLELYDLVELAAEACFQLLVKLKKTDERIIVLAGGGNNGADAFVVARKLLEAKCHCSLFYSSAKQTTEELTIAKNRFLAAGGVIQPLSLSALNSMLETANTIVDGLIGIGFKGLLRHSKADIIEYINDKKSCFLVDKPIPWVLSIDTPSGINVDTGHCDPVAIKADATLCLGGLKQGLFTAQARNFTGDIYLAELGMVAFFSTPSAFLRNPPFLTGFTTKRPRYCNKGFFGKVLAVGGDFGMPGAIRLCSEGALRVGAGLVAVASRSMHQLTINNGRPELMFYPLDELDSDIAQQAFMDKMNWASMLILGPGMGTAAWGQKIFNQVLLQHKPCVMDADALNLLSQTPSYRSNWILTPHPGEAARLLTCSIAEVESNRFEAIKEIHRQYGGVILLKGAGTLIYDGNNMSVINVGNPGLASGGCGDVLSGIIGGLVAQHFDLVTATLVGAVIHGLAAEQAAKEGERGMLASDLMPYIRLLVN